MILSQAQVLLTGGGRGIGRYLLSRLVDDAHGVAVFERDEALITEIAATYPKAKCYACDVSEPDAVSRAMTSLENEGFEIDLLINNAGIIHSAPLINFLQKQDRIHSVSDWQRVINANLSSVFYVTGHVVDHMLKRRKKGAVVSMSSISANGNAGQSAYAAAKAGIEALTHTWAKELGMFGLRFVAIAPGFISTPSTHQALSDAIIGKLKQQIPLRRLGEVENIYQTVRYIVENDYLSGTVVEVNGGLTI